MANSICVGPAATGSGSGADWDNLAAWSATPVRGDTWYLVDGTYSAKTCSTVASGTTLVTIKKATVADHGGITVGWSDTLGDGQATIGKLTVTTSNWLFDGQTGNGTASQPPDTTPSNYGFNLNDGTNCLYLGTVSANTTNTEFRHIYALASASDVEKIFVQGQQSTTFSRSNITISHCLLDGWQNGFMTRGQSASPYTGCVWEYNICLNGSSTATNHGEWINPNEQALSGMIIRYNIFKDYSGTDGQTGTIVANNSNNTNVEIYGNVFDNLRVGNGVVTGTSAGNMVNALLYNNTFLNMTVDSGAWINGPGSGNIAINNLIYNMAAAPGTSWTHDYNAFFSTTGTPSETHRQRVAGNPFTNYAALDYTLIANTAVGTTLPSPYNVDMLGETRTTWTRGAYEFLFGGGGGGGGASTREHYATNGGVALYWNSFAPTPAVPAPACIVLHAGGYKTGRPGPDFVSQDLAAAGFWGLSVEYRLAPPSTEMNTPQHESPGQNTVGDTGHYPKQTTDVQTAIRTARADPRCNGLVYCLGGSAGGSHALFMAATGTAGDDMPDLAVIQSCGISNHADPNSWQYTNPGDETWPAGAVSNYLDITNTCPALPGGADLALCQASSGITHIHSGMPPMFILISERDSLGIPTSTGLDINSYGKDNTIGPLEDGSNGLIPALIAAGYTESTSTMPENGTYKKLIVHTTSHRHAFQYWRTDAPSGVPVGSSTVVIPWLLAGPDGTEPPPPPPPPANDLLGYRLWVTGGPGTGQSPIGPDATTAQITELVLNTNYVAHLVAFNKFGDSPEATYSFQSNSGTTARTPHGLFEIGGFPLENPGFGGDRQALTWAQTNPADGVYNWTTVDAFIAAADAVGKQKGVAIRALSAPPQWVVDLGAVLYTGISLPDPMVLPFDPIVLPNLLAYTAALCQHLDGIVDYITIGGLGHKIESYMPLPGDLTPAVATSNDDFIAAWVDSSIQIIDTHASNLSSTPFIIAAGTPFKLSPDGQNALTDVVTHGLTHHLFGIMQWGLNANSSNSFYINKWIQDNDVGRTCGFQMTGSQTEPHVGGNLQGTLEECLAAGNALGADFIEVYGIDGENPALADVLATYNELLK